MQVKRRQRLLQRRRQCRRRRGFHRRADRASDQLREGGPGFLQRAVPRRLGQPRVLKPGLCLQQVVAAAPIELDDLLDAPVQAGDAADVVPGQGRQRILLDHLDVGVGDLQRDIGAGQLQLLVGAGKAGALPGHFVVRPAGVVERLDGLDAQVARAVVAIAADIAVAGLEDQSVAGVHLAARAGDLEADRLCRGLRAEHPRVGLQRIVDRFGKRLCRDRPGRAGCGGDRDGDREADRPPGIRPAGHGRVQADLQVVVKGWRPSIG